MRKKTLLAFAAVFVLGCTLLCGCMPGEKSKEDAAMKYMKEKYGTEFKAHSFTKNWYGNKKDVVDCRPVGDDLDGDYASVCVWKESGEYRCSDNYVGYMLRPQMEGLVSKYVSKEFKDFKLYKSNEGPSLDSSLGKDSTINDVFKADKWYEITINVYLKADSKDEFEKYDEKADRIGKELAKTGYRYFVSFYTTDADTYEKTSRHDLKAFNDLYIRSMDEDPFTGIFHTYSYTISDGKVGY